MAMQAQTGETVMKAIHEWKTDSALRKEFAGDLPAFVKWMADPALRKEFVGNRAAYAAYHRASESGQVKIIGSINR